MACIAEMAQVAANALYLYYQQSALTDALSILRRTKKGLCGGRIRQFVMLSLFPYAVLAVSRLQKIGCQARHSRQTTAFCTIPAILLLYTPLPAQPRAASQTRHPASSNRGVLIYFYGFQAFTPSPARTQEEAQGAYSPMQTNVTYTKSYLSCLAPDSFFMQVSMHHLLRSHSGTRTSVRASASGSPL